MIAIKTVRTQIHISSDVLVAVALLDLKDPNWGGLSSDSDVGDVGDVNKKVQKAKGLFWQNNNFARASRFSVHFFAVTTAGLQRETEIEFHVLWRTWRQDNDFLFFFLNFDKVF